MKIQKLISVLFILVLLSSMNSGFARAVFAEEPSPLLLASPSVIRVPEDYPNLQNAIDNVPDGGIIDLSSGTYPAPEGGFLINDMQKGFTIRARQNGEAILDGGGSRNILQAINSDLSMGRPIIFQGLVFANGYSNSAGLAGGATFYNAYTTFVDCIFRDNVAGLAGRGGGTFVAVSSTAFFFNCIWENNTAMTSGGGLEINENAKAYIHNSQFIGNRTNPPGHSLASAGGAIHVGDSTLRVSNTRFENNQAGYVGGGIYIVGTWTAPYTTPRSDVIIANCTFINNQATPDPSVSIPGPTEAGAIHAENQTTARIYNSRFITNSAMVGGGVNNYRALVYIYNSVFQGNRATGTSMGGFGAAIAAHSNDVSSDLVNYRPAYLEVRDSLIQGRYGGVTIVSQESGGVGIGGDYNRMYGTNGVSQMGTVADNRAVAIISNVIFTDLDVQKPSGGVGGALSVALTDLTIQNSLIINSNAIGTDNSSGGGMTILVQTQANVSDSTFGHNMAQRYGGAIFAQGSELNLSNCNLIENSNPTQYGSAIFTAQDGERNLPASGTVQTSIFSNNSLPMIFDDDRLNGPINDVHYNNNQFYDSSGISAGVYKDPIVGTSSSASQLNNLVVVRNNGTSTDKGSGNTALSSAPMVGKILAVPPQILTTNANGDAAPPTLAYLGYAWSGASATLDGQAVTGNAGVSPAGTGSHTLSIGGTNYTASISQAPTPAAVFTASGASPVTLNWSVTAGTFLDVAIDHGVTIPSTVSGSVQVSPPVDTDYWLYVITEEGGIVKSVSTGAPILSVPAAINPLAGLNYSVNKGAFTIQNDGNGTLQWTATSQTPDLITMDTPNGQTTANGTFTIAFTLNVGSLSPGDYVGTINVDAGTAGTALVTVNVKLFSILYKIYLPLVLH